MQRKEGVKRKNQAGKQQTPISFYRSSRFLRGRLHGNKLEGESMVDTIEKLRILALILASTAKDSYDFWRREVWNNDLDCSWCCNGKECGCGGQTIRQVFQVQKVSKPAAEKKPGKA
jgi:hypothetical protein